MVEKEHVRGVSRSPVIGRSCAPEPCPRLQVPRVGALGWGGREATGGAGGAAAGRPAPAPAAQPRQPQPQHAR